MKRNIFNKHLKDNNLSYFEHMLTAFIYTYKCLIVGIKMLIHAFIPFIFEETGWKELGKFYFKKTEIDSHK
jgi:hypothetical protein